MGRGKRRTRLQKQAPLAEYLKLNQLWKKPVAKDGSCLFRAVAEQVGLCQESHIEVRHSCADYIAEHQAQFKEFLTKSPEAYADGLKDTNVWGGEVELFALSQLYSRSVVVCMESEGKVETKMFLCSAEKGRTLDELTNPIMLAYLDGNHYDIIWSLDHKEATTLCQAIVLEAVNKAVFDIEGGGDESIMYTLNPTTYRNFPLEIYQSQKTSMEAYSHEMAITMQFEAEDNCEGPTKSQNKEGVVQPTNMAVPSNMRGGGAEEKGTGQKQQGRMTHSRPQRDPSPRSKQQANGPCVRESPGTSTVQQHDWSNKEKQHASDTRVPEAPGTRVPETSGTKVPEISGTKVPETSGTKVPETSGTRLPEAAGTRVPEAAGTRVPETSDTRVPQTRVPEAAGTKDAPGTKVPVAAGARVPGVSGTKVPGTAGTSVRGTAGTKVAGATGTGAAGTRVPEAAEIARPVDSKRPIDVQKQSERIHPKVGEGTLSSPQPSSPKTIVPRPSAVTDAYDQSAAKNSSFPYHSRAPAKYSDRVIPNASSHVSMGSCTSDDFDAIGLSSSGDDEVVCQDVTSHEELGRRLRECAQQIPGQLETGAWHEGFSKFQLGVEVGVAHQHRSLRVEEDGGNEWPPLEDEINYRGQGPCVTAIARETVEQAGPSSLPLLSEGVAIAMTTLQTEGREDGRFGTQTLMVVPELTMPVTATTTADVQLVPVERLAPPSMEGQSPSQFAAIYSLQCLEVFLAHGGGMGVDPQAVHQMMSQLRHLLDKSKGEVGRASESPTRLNNEEEHFLFSFQNPSDHTTPGHQLEDVTSPQLGTNMVTGSFPYDSNVFTHQAFLPDSNLIAPPTSVPSNVETVSPLLTAGPLPVDPSHPHLPSSFGPDELSFDSRPAFMGPMMPPLMAPYLHPFPMWIPPHMMMPPPMMAMMGGPVPCPPLDSTSTTTPTTAVLGDHEVTRSQMEGQEGEEREESGEERAAEDEEEAECDPFTQQPKGLEVVTSATALHLTDTESQQSATSEHNGSLKEEHPAEVPPPATPPGPLPSLPRRPAAINLHEGSPQPPADSSKEENGNHGNNRQGQPHHTRSPFPRPQGQRPEWGNFKRYSYHGNNYKHTSKSYYEKRGPPNKHQVPYEVTRGVADKTIPGDHSSAPSCSLFQSSWSGNQSPSYHSYSYPRQPYHPHHSGVTDQSFDSTRSQITSRPPREWRQNWHDYDSVIANQQRMLDRYPKKYSGGNPERYPERNPERLPERYPERNPERLPERNPERNPGES